MQLLLDGGGKLFGSSGYVLPQPVSRIKGNLSYCGQFSEGLDSGRRQGSGGLEELPEGGMRYHRNAGYLLYSLKPACVSR